MEFTAGAGSNYYAVLQTLLVFSTLFVPSQQASARPEKLAVRSNTVQGDLVSFCSLIFYPFSTWIGTSLPIIQFVTSDIDTRADYFFPPFFLPATTLKAEFVSSLAA